MHTNPPAAKKPRQIGRFVTLLILLWSIAAMLSVQWNIHNQHETMQHAAEITAREQFKRDVLYRQWSAMHGGTYAPVTEQTPPNPWLNIEERDIAPPPEKTDADQPG